MSGPARDPTPEPGDRISDLFRRWGYLHADLDWLGRIPVAPWPDLGRVRGAVAEEMRRWYCGTLAAEFMHIPDPARRDWIAGRMESVPEPADSGRIVARLEETKIFDQFLQSRYPGTKRYSLEGASALIPLLDALLSVAAESGARIGLIGMSHRGRLSVMAHVVNVPLPEIFAGFEDVDPRSVLGGGDVKYHLGATGTHRTIAGSEIDLHLVSNPSHLEAVDPVLVGRARARQTRLGSEGRAQVLPVLLHGDAAFAGQGIASETLNMAALPGFNVGGTIHVVVNNLIGFTTSPASLHSSRYASDVAKRNPVPVLHVNGEDPEAVERAGRIAAAYRYAFGSDVVIDLVCYRRFGHSEVDDPTITQPLLYAKIRERPPLYEAYAERAGVEPRVLDEAEASIRSRLEAGLEAGRRFTVKPRLRTLPAYWDRYSGGAWEASMETGTAVEIAALREMGRRLSEPPSGFHVHPRVKVVLDRRREMAEGTRPVDWAMAEALAFASLLSAGVPVRLSGQDSRRGTFGQRHAALVDTETGAEHVPLAGFPTGSAFFEIRDTILSEAAALGFEYGFSRDYPEALVCWEAQFGDFANGAQVIIDQFVCAAEDKWDLLSGIVLLLPHGFEGQGPEHSSARLERFLQAAAEQNIQVCQPSTAAQIFHLLRRQVLRPWRKPLVILTPKSSLRLKSAASPLGDLATGSFRCVLPDPDGQKGERLLVCTGKLAHELFAERRKRKLGNAPILRLEQIYPVPDEAIGRALGEHPESREIVWIQEEPANMGALQFIRPHLERLSGGRRVTSLRRTASASPATGSLEAHHIEQRTLLDLAFGKR